MVYGTIFYGGPNWDRPLGDHRIDIWGVGAATSCYTLEQQGNDAFIDIKYYIGHPTPSPICGSSASCVDFYRPTPMFNPKHHEVGVAFMRSAHVPPSNPDEYKRNINHETGHVWGLKDPDYINQFYGGCFSAQDPYTYSVMHQYLHQPPPFLGYCDTSGGYPVPYRVYPEVQDLITVRDNKMPAH